LTGAPRRFLIVDANVLIDYAATDRAILGLVNRYLGTVCIPRPILDEVTQLSATDCDRLGLLIVDGSVEQLLEAGRVRGRLSFHDRLCLILAEAEGWTCVTNDKALRRSCGELSIPVLWGLELMAELVFGGKLSREAALEVARSIQRINPRHITADILQRFELRLTLKDS
jgi:predicted nucleic acid-binding protein